MPVSSAKPTAVAWSTCRARLASTTRPAQSAAAPPRPVADGTSVSTSQPPRVTSSGAVPRPTGYANDSAPRS
jgi:hypothetical protein